MYNNRILFQKINAVICPLECNWPYKNLSSLLHKFSSGVKFSCGAPQNYELQANWTPVVAGVVLWNRLSPFVLPSFCMFFCPGVFPGLDHKFFLNFGMVLELYINKVVPDRAGFFSKTFLVPKIEKMGQSWVFLNSLKNFVINFSWICSMKKIILLMISFAVFKIVFLKYGPKSSQPANQSVGFIITYISKINWWNAWFFACWYKFTKMGVVNLVMWLLNWLYLKRIEIKKTDFLLDATNSGKLKLPSMIFRWV